MKILFINTFNFGSTGNIMLSLSERAQKAGMETMVCVPAGKSNSKIKTDNQIIIGTRFSHNLHILFSKLTGFQGIGSVLSTWIFLRKVKKFSPDVVHLNNLHNNYINLPMLFHFIKKYNISVVWTLHDCWAMTGHCPFFAAVKCQKWKNGCHNCPQYRLYPSSNVDRTKVMWKLKRKWFSDIPNLVLVTPSYWLSGLVRESFLKQYPVKVIHNGIDLNVFKPTASDFRKKYDLEDSYIVLGVAAPWGSHKGKDVFVELSKRLPDDYRIVMVGTTEEDDNTLPSNIISVHRTADTKELAEIYTSADVFANPTREEVLGLVNLEALACGTPVVTFKTGGSPECIDENTGIVVPCEDLDAMEKAILYICREHPFHKDKCIDRAKKFDKNLLYGEYIKLYENMENHFEA